MDPTALLTTALTVVALFAAVWGGVKAAGVGYRRTIGSRRDLASRLDLLACGVTREYVDSLLGAPAFRRTGPFGAELVYTSRHAWISTLSLGDAVIALSVTVTDPKFWFRSSHLTFGQVGVQIGRSVFSKLPEPQGRMLSIGARRLQYIEHFYFGNPGAYQDYLFSFNDAGVGGIALGEGIDNAGIQGPSGIFRASGEDAAPAIDPPAAGRQALRKFRAETTINTLTVFELHSGPDLVATWAGVDYDHVRVLRAERGK